MLLVCTSISTSGSIPVRLVWKRRDKQEKSGGLISCYLSYDFFWAVFHVTDQLGNKITDEKLIEFLQQVRYRHICQIEESHDYM